MMTEKWAKALDNVQERREPGRLKQNDDFPDLPPAKDIAQEVWTELQPWLDLCERTWGFRPPITLDWQDCEKTRVIIANFNIKGFQHDGARMYVNKRSFGTWRNPERLAKEIIGEITGHRNTCADCGEGVASLRERVRGGYGGANKEIGFTYRNDDGKVVRLDLMVPPDPVEQALHPRMSKMMRERLESPEGKAILASPKRAKYMEMPRVCEVTR
jgi:hypothetical protein